MARLAEIGGIPKPMTPAEFGKLIADETEKWRKVVEFAGRLGGLTQSVHGIAGSPRRPVNGGRTVAGRSSAAARGGACSSMVRAGRS